MPGQVAATIAARMNPGDNTSVADRFPVDFRPMKLPARPIRGARPIPFTWLDGLVLAGSAALAIGWAVSADREFLELLSSFASRRMPWPNLPQWVEDLELPAKRIARDFTTFLSVMSMGIALASFRRHASCSLVGLPRPGIAATATAALVLMAREVWIHGLVWLRSAGFVGFPRCIPCASSRPQRTRPQRLPTRCASA
jgi:hypothetical protein